MQEVAVPAAETHLTIEQGVTWSNSWQPTADGDPVADETWTAKAQVRATKTPTGELLHEWTDDDANASVDDEGIVTLTVTAAESEDWEWELGYYDLEISKAGQVIRVAQGIIRVDSGVTV